MPLRPRAGLRPSPPGPWLAGARHSSLDYEFKGPAPDRGLGLEAPLDCTRGTRSQTAGPYYTPSTPRRADLREPDTTGAPLVFEGVVLTPDCRPVAGAVIDIWHCDEHGRYDNEGFRYRGHQFTDRAGAYRFETIRPKRYVSRTAHIHVMVQGEATPLLTTQVYFPDFGEDNARGLHFPRRPRDAARTPRSHGRVARALRLRARPRLTPVPPARAPAVSTAAG